MLRNHYSIIPLKREDIDGVIQLWKACKPCELPAYTAPEKEIWNIYKNPRAHYDPEGILVAKSNDEIIGFVASVFHHSPKISYLLVHPNYRNSDLGDELLAAVVDFLRRQCKSVRVRIDQKNEYTESLLMRSGFEKVDMRAEPYGEKYSWESGYPLDMAVHLEDLKCPPWLDEIEKKLTRDGVTFTRLEKRHHASYVEFMEEEFPFWHRKMVHSGIIDPVTRDLDAKKADLSRVWVAVRDDETVGVFGLGIGVRKSLRRKGVGTVLLFKYLNDMKQRGETVCDLGDTYAVSFYQQAGATITRKYWEMKKNIFE